MMRNNGKRTLEVASTLLLLSALTACGEGSQAPGSETVEVEARDRGELEQLIADYTQAPAFDHPGPAIDISSLRGETIYVIPLDMRSEFNQLTTEATIEAGEAAGVNVEVFSASGNPSEWQQGFAQAIREDARAIILQGPQPDLVAPQIREANAAEIPVVSAHSIDIVQEEGVVSKFDDLHIGPSGPFTLGTKMMADFVTVKSDGAADTLYVQLTDFGETQQLMVTAWEKELAAQCPDCETTIVDTTFADIANSTNSAVAAALRRNPDITWIGAAFDAQAPHINSALKSLGREDIKVVTFNGTTGGLALVNEEGPLVMNVGEPIPVQGWAALDQAMRLALGEDPVDQPEYMRIFTPENIADVGEPPSPVAGYGDPSTFTDGFKELWGVK